MVRVHKAMTNAPGMEQSEVDIFLSTSKIPLRLGTVDSKGDPMIHPVWFDYSNGKLYLMSDKDTRKVRNIRGERTVYFSVDTDAEPHKGVKGKRHRGPSHGCRKVNGDVREDSGQISWRPQHADGKENHGRSEEGLRSHCRDYTTLLLNLGLFQDEKIDQYSRIVDGEDKATTGIIVS